MRSSSLYRRIPGRGDLSDWEQTSQISTERVKFVISFLRSQKLPRAITVLKGQISNRNK